MFRHVLGANLEMCNFGRNFHLCGKKQSTVTVYFAALGKESAVTLFSSAFWSCSHGVFHLELSERQQCCFSSVDIRAAGVGSD